MRLVVLALGLIWCAVLASHVGAAPDEDPFEDPKMFQVPDTVAARNALEEARASLARNETTLGLRSLQRILDTMSDDYARVPEAASAHALLWRSAAEVAAEMLASLTPAQSAAYDHLVQPSAEPAMEAAWKRGDWVALEDIARRYGASRYGARATRVLAELALEAGRGREAARFAADGLRFAPADPALLRLRSEGLTVAGLHAVPHGWGGDMSRRGGTATTWSALPAPRWTAGFPRSARKLDPTPFPDGRPDPTPQHFRHLLDASCPIVPVLDGRTAFVSDGRMVVALDLSSGRPLWRYDKSSDSRLTRVDAELDGRTALDRAFAPVVAGDLVVATVEVPYRYYPEQIGGIPLSTYLPRRRVVALDRTTGEVGWMAGARDDDPDWLREASVVAPVAVSEGIVVALVDHFLQTHNLSVVGFDLSTGRLLWRARLGYGSRETNLFGNPLRELAGSAIAVADGHAFVTTGLGLVASIDLLAGRARWVASYVTMPIEPVIAWYEAPLRRPQLGPTRTIVAGDLVVVAPSDADHVSAYRRSSGHLVWRHMLRQRLTRRTVAHLIGVVGEGAEACVIVSQGGVTALELATGELRWYGRPDPDPGDTIGEGAIVGDEVLLPTAAGLQRFSISREGSYRGREPWPRGVEPGNLVVGDDVLLIAGRESVVGLYDWDRIAAQIERQRAERGDDPWFLIEAGDLYLRGGELGRAKEMFLAAEAVGSRTGKGAVEAARRGLVATMLQEGGVHENTGAVDAAITAYRSAADAALHVSDRVVARLRLLALVPEGSAAWRETLQQMIDEDGDEEAWIDESAQPVRIRAWARLKLANAEEARGALGAAIDLWQAVLIDDPEEDVLGEMAGRVAGRRIAASIAVAGRSLYDRHEAAARDLLAAAHDEEAIDLVLARYPNSLVREEALRRRARMRQDADHLAAASEDWRALGSSARDPRDRAAALAELVRIETRRGATGSARATRNQLRDEYADVSFAIDGVETTGASWSFEVPRPTARRGSGAADRPLGAPLKEILHERADDEPPLIAVETVVDDAWPRSPLALLYRGDALVAIDLERGERAFVVALDPVVRAALTPGIVVVLSSRGDVLLGLDDMSGEERWRVDLGGSARWLAIHGGIVFTAQRNVSQGDGLLRVRAFDAMTGSVLWTTPLGRADPANLVANAESVWLRRTRYFENRSLQDVVVLDVADGRVAHELPLAPLSLLEPWTDGRVLVAAGRTSAATPTALVGFDLSSGRTVWRHEVPGAAPTAMATAPDGQLVLLTADGRVRTFDPADGDLVHETGIFIGQNVDARPYPGTSLLVERDRLVLLPFLRTRAGILLAFERTSGKLIREHALTDAGVLTAAALGRAGDRTWAYVMRGARPRAAAEIIVLGPTSEIEQRVDVTAIAGAGHHLTVLASHGALFVAGRREASVLR